MPLLHTLVPELILAIAAVFLFLLGASPLASSRKLAPSVAVLALVGAFLSLSKIDLESSKAYDPSNAILQNHFTVYVGMLACAVSVLFVLLAWPSNVQGTGNRSLQTGSETGEYFALLLLCVTGILIVARANNFATLFLGIELASIPTYIMVTMSRPQEVAQEAGIKYFFLGAASAAIMLLGISYLYGSTGTLQMDEISHRVQQQLAGQTVNVVGSMEMLAIVLILVGFSFKLAAFPMHFYVGDVYQGAATPVTALISFVPKISGIVAILKLLQTISGDTWLVPVKIQTLLFVIAIVTMTLGNVLALLQYNVKRVLAYSSVAHSGYLLAGISAACLNQSSSGVSDALRGVLFYIAAYGIMNAAAFGVMMLLPSRQNQPALTAETYDDLTGAAWQSPVLGIAMAVGCFSLIGLPLTAGFWGKLQLILPALDGKGDSRMIWLAIAIMVNAAISAAYYLKIISVMWLKRRVAEPGAPVVTAERSLPIALAVGLSVVGILILGTVNRAIDQLSETVKDAQSSIHH